MDDEAANRRKLFQGAGLVAFGMGFELMFSFFAKVGVARYLGKTDFGLFSIGFALVSVTTIVGLIGLPDGIARLIPRAESKQEEIGIIVTGSLISIGVSLVIMLTILLAAGPVISLTSHGQTLMRVVQISSLAIPLVVVSRVAVGVGRGYENAALKVLIQNFLRPGAFFAATAIVLVVGINSVIATYIIPVSYLPGAAFGLYYLTTHLNGLSAIRSLTFRNELLMFSAPLMISGFMRKILSYFDTFLIAVFRPAAQVGVYNAVYPLSQLSSIFLASFGFIVLPMFSSIDSRADHQGIQPIYTFSTNWIVVGAIPVALVFSLFPNELISLTFGSQYASGSATLLILTLGFFTNSILGPNANALIALGESKAILRFTTIAAVLNMILNILLIPHLGINGAAIATALSYIFLTLRYSVKLYRIEGIIPFGWNVVTLVAISGVVGVVLSTIIGWAEFSPILTFMVFGLVFGPVYLGLVFATEILKRGDVLELLSFISRRS